MKSFLVNINDDKTVSIIPLADGVDILDASKNFLPRQELPNIQAAYVDVLRPAVERPVPIPKI